MTPDKQKQKLAGQTAIAQKVFQAVPIADGRHRVLKAIALGKRTIKARRMTWKPDPCRREEVKS
ncbi:hypothetical protein N5C96_29300 [Delftia tsuruhatensis]|uniref:hypothetical protein n=1 Tax=Delftia tsuruhatensis TaxID=180282 RepID=UPI00244D0050|nr:hypothetical protein [Delftia tsuruhatensis]MDH0777516.1 hypothetical protein [Delftia tsuruhatensis]